MANKNDRIKAHHEAGHCVVARALNIETAYVTLFSTAPENSAAAVTGSAMWLARDIDVPSLMLAIEKDVKVALGGPYSDRKLRPGGRRPPDGWSDDLNRASDYVLRAVLIK